MIKKEKTEEDYFNLLGMFGTVLNHIGGHVEIPMSEIEAIDLKARELKSWFDPETNTFVFELSEIINA